MRKLVRNGAIALGIAAAVGVAFAASLKAGDSFRRARLYRHIRDVITEADTWYYGALLQALGEPSAQKALGLLLDRPAMYVQSVGELTCTITVGVDPAHLDRLYFSLSGTPAVMGTMRRLLLHDGINVVRDSIDFATADRRIDFWMAVHDMPAGYQDLQTRLTAMPD